MTTPWYPIMAGVGMLLAAMVSYYSSQISIAGELGTRPTRQEMREVIEQYHTAVLRELDIIKGMIKRRNNHG